MTKLTELLSIQYPIFQGAMAWVSEARLAAAVSEAGGAGIIASGGRDAEWVREQVHLTKTLTSKPFGVNLQLMSMNKEEILDVVCTEKVAFVTMGAGNPIPFFTKLVDAGIKKIPIVPNVKLARRVEEYGADAVVIEGMEAGGHIGVLTTMALMTQVIPLMKIPVIPAGGFADGRGLAAALVMGAAGIQMGTRFLLAEECAAHSAFKQRIIEAVDTDTVITGLTTGHMVRGLRNAFTDRFLSLERNRIATAELDKIAAGTSRMASMDGDVENGMVQAGQSVYMLKEIEPVRVIVERIMAEAREALKNASGLL